MDKQRVESLIEKYINSACSAEEEQIIENFLDQVQAKNKNWDTSLFGPEDSVKEKIYQSILQKIQPPTANHKKQVLQWHMIKVAATIALMLAFGFAAYWLFVHPKGEKEYHVQTLTVSVPFGETTSLKLCDGTKVTLNAGSHFLYPESFNSTSREVNLEGEAYFEVVHSDKAPFVVKTNELDIIVLGTAFNVCSYPGENIVETTLVKGKVSLRVNHNNATTNNDIILKPGQRAVYSKNANTLHIERVNTRLFTSWKDGLLVFSDTPLTDLTQRLHRWYDVGFVFLNDEIKTYLYTVTFENEPLPDVLNILAEMTPITYTINSGIVTIDLDIERKNKFKIK